MGVFSKLLTDTFAPAKTAVKTTDAPAVQNMMKAWESDSAIVKAEAPGNPRLNKTGTLRDMEGADTAAIATERFGENPPPPAMEAPIFNLDRIQAEDDIKLLFDDVAARFPDRFAEYTRGVQSLNDIEERALAGMFGLTSDGVRQMRALKSEEFTKAGFTLVNMATEIKKLATKVNSPAGSEQDAANLRLLMDDFVTTTMHVKGMQTETARTLSAMRIAKRETANATAQVAEIVGQYGGMGMQKRLASLIDQLDVSTPEGMAKFGKFVQKAHRATGWDMAWEIYYGAILSGMHTHVVNFGTSLAAYGWRLPEYLGAYAIGKARHAMTGGEHGLYWKEISAFSADADIIAHAARTAWSSAKSGRPSDLTTKFDPQLERRAITAANVRAMIDENVVTKYLTEMVPGLLADGKFHSKAFDLFWDWAPIGRGPGRVMVTADEFNKGLAMMSSLKQQAARTAVEEGLSGKVYADRLAQLIDNPEALMPGAMDEARRFAQEITFQTPLSGAMDKVQKFVFNDPQIESAAGRFVARVGQVMIRAVAPFIRTPVNVAKYALERATIPGLPIPTAVLMPSFWDALKAGGPKADLALSKMALGSAISYSLFQVAMGDYITGAGPTDNKVAAQWRALGFQENSVVLDKESAIGKSLGLEASLNVSYKRADPFSMIVGFAADAKDIWEYATPDERNIMAVTMTAAIYRNLNNRTFLEGFGNLQEAMAGLEEGNLKKAEEFLARTFSSPLVPSGASWIGRQVDPSLRVSRDTRSERSALAGFKEDEKGNLVPRGREREPVDEAFGEIMAFGEQVMNKVRSRVPGWNKDLPARLDFYGREVVNAPGLVFDMFPFYTKAMQFEPSKLEEMGLDPTRWTGTKAQQIGANWGKFINEVGPEGEFIRLGWAPGRHPNRIMGVPLTPQEYHTYVKAVNTVRPVMADFVFDGTPVMEISGMTLREATAAVMRTPEYFEAPDEPEMPGSKARMISQLNDRYRHDVDMDPMVGLGGGDLLVFMRHENLRQRLTAARAAQTPPDKLLEMEGLLQ